MDDGRVTVSDHIEGRFNYIVADGKRPFAYQFGPPPGMPLRSHAYVEHSMRVRNARLHPGLSLDREGFLLVPHSTEFAAWDDDAAVKSAYYPQAEALVRRVTGAARVFAFDHNVRSAPRAGRGEAGIREPVRRVHNDYTAKSGPQRVRDLMGDEAPALLKNRFAVVNVWRPTRGVVYDTPLGVIDASSIAPDDLISTDLRYPDRTGEIQSVAWNPAHRWYYVPRMRPDEALLLKCFDSAEDGRARFAAHAAFDDPAAPPGAPPRESIEVRTLAFFAPEPSAR